jgi:hypothetical protein
MSMIARDIATIPSQNFSWYVLFLEDAFDDPIKSELSSNVIALGHEIGPHALAVRGYEPDKFFESAHETLTLYQPEWAKKIVRPALLVSDTPPAQLLSDSAKLGSARLILVPLANFRGQPPGALTDFLRQLSATLRDPDAIRALSQLEPSAVAKHWRWLSKYVVLKPSFMGFGADLNKMLTDLTGA